MSILSYTVQSQRRKNNKKCSERQLDSIKNRVISLNGNKTLVTYKAIYKTFYYSIHVIAHQKSKKNETGVSNLMKQIYAISDKYKHSLK
jgi:hypothetical protein